MAQKITNETVRQRFLAMCYKKGIYKTVYSSSEDSVLQRTFVDLDYIDDAFISSHLLLLIAREAEKGSIPYSPHEVYSKVAELKSASDDIWFAWAKYELENGNTGNFGDPEEYTARWILREARLRGKKGGNFSVWKRWAELEEESGNTGSFSDPAEYTARWIFRDTCLQQEIITGSYSLLQAWVRLEWKEGKKEKCYLGAFDSPEKYTARWVLREICTQRKQLKTSKSQRAWLLWAEFEWKQGQNDDRYIGDIDNPEENTARWIVREVWQKSGVPSITNKEEGQEEQELDYDASVNPKDSFSSWIDTEAAHFQTLQEETKLP